MAVTAPHKGLRRCVSELLGDRLDGDGQPAPALPAAAIINEATGLDPGRGTHALDSEIEPEREDRERGRDARDDERSVTRGREEEEPHDGSRSRPREQCCRGACRPERGYQCHRRDTKDESANGGRPTLELQGATG